MMAGIIFQHFEKKGGSMTVSDFAKEFKIQESYAREILNYGDMVGVLFSPINNEYQIVSNAPEEAMEEFQGFLDKFHRSLKRLKDANIFSQEVQAHKFEEVQPFFYDRSGIFWMWDVENWRWEITDDVEILNMINEATGKDTINSKQRTEILNRLKQMGRRNIPEDIKPYWIQFRETIFDIQTGDRFIAKPSHFVSNPIPWKHAKSPDTPTFDKLFTEWVGEDHVQELYEILAFCMVPNYFIHRIICLIGSGANGKSTFLKILKKLIGRDNITSVSLDALMTTRFTGAKLLKKLVCIMGETNFNTFRKTDYIKSLSGEDEVPAEIKNKNPFDFENYAKLVMATNSLPMTSDKTDGFYRRWKIVDFPNKFTEEKDIFSTIPEKEFEALALKCFNIAKDLWEKRTFTGDGSFDDRRIRYESRSNPIMLYLQENFEKDLNSEVLFSEFFDGLKEFFLESGFREQTKPAVTKQLKADGFDVKNMTKDKINGTYILGIRAKGTMKQEPQLKITVEKVK